MIIHIHGASGSGKTTLGKRLAKHKRFMVVETDDIDDHIAMKIINSKKHDHLFTFKNMDKFFKLKDKTGDIAMKKITDKAKKDNKIVIAVGMIITPKNITHKYYVKVDADTNYRRFNLRTMDDVCNNYQEIKELMNNTNISIHKIHMTLLFKYKVRGGIPRGPPETRDYLKMTEKKARKKKYKILSADEIYNEIINL